MRFIIRFSKPTVKSLQQHLRQAYGAGSLRLVRRISMLLSLAAGEGVTATAQIFAISRQTVYTWLKAFMVQGPGSLTYRRPPGRKAKLTKTQRKQLVA